MTRRAVHVTIVLLAVTCVTSWPTEPLRAHGGSAAALSVAAFEDARAEVVRLNDGLALRRPEGYRFVCPILWGQDTAAPTDSIPGGPVAIGAAMGIYLLDRDGRIEPHPDPEAAAGQVAAFARMPSGLFGLRYRSTTEVEVVRIDAQRVEVVWTGEQRFQDLAAADGFLALVRVDGMLVAETRISPTGELLSHDSAVVAAPATLAWARPLGDALQIVLVSASLDAELGFIDEGAWETVVRGVNIAGPIALADGTRVLGLEGVLHVMEDGELRELDRESGAECLRRDDGIAYACSMGDLRMLEGPSIGAHLFRLDSLIEPDLDQVPDALREECELQWQRYVLLDLGMRGITPRDLTNTADGGGDPDAGVDPSARDAAVEGGAARVPDEARRSSGCQVSLSTRGASSLAGLAAPALVLLLMRRRLALR